MALPKNDWKLSELVSMSQKKRFEVEERWLTQIVPLGDGITMLTLALGAEQFTEAFALINAAVPQYHVMQVQATDDAIYVCFALPIEDGKAFEKQESNAPEEPANG